jgi:serine/threonine-protein kinase HipA
MSINGKRDSFELTDLVEVGKVSGLRAAKVRNIVISVLETKNQWSEAAESAGVKTNSAIEIQSQFRDLV